MRRTGVFDVAEVEIHDHWIRGRPGPPTRARSLRFPESPGGDWTIFQWPGSPAPEHARDPGLWTMALAHRGHLERALAELVKGPGAFADRLAMLHHVRGSVLERANRLADARAAYERALVLDPLLAESSINLGAVLTRLGKLAEARTVLEQVLARYPRADSALRNRAALRLAMNDEAGAYADLEASQRLLPSVPVAQALARIAEARGDAAAARRWQAEAAQLDPRAP
jgi:tetratricopeptide (TPR) repeat protein